MPLTEGEIVKRIVPSKFMESFEIFRLSAVMNDGKVGCEVDPTVDRQLLEQKLYEFKKKVGLIKEEEEDKEIITKKKLKKIKR